MMSEAIKNFPKQFSYQPEIVGELPIKKFTRFVLVGMGGSHLAADALGRLYPHIDITVRRDYGLPVIFDPEHTLIILSSYSGGTEEVLSAAYEALKKKYPLCAVAVGGKLLELAQEQKIPYIQLPNTGIQPRSAWGFSLRALLRILGAENELHAMEQLSNWSSEGLEPEGRELASRLNGKVPLIYSSEANYSIAYNWKIKFNETGKIPAFYNVVPELNHNEMNGFDVVDRTRELSANFNFIFLRDSDDYSQIQKRFDVLKKLYTSRGLGVIEVPLSGTNPIEKMVRSLALADWTAVAIAEQYGLESEQVPMVEEFKRLIV